MSKSDLFIISGSSGAGKNTLINCIVSNNNNCKFLVSHTSRDRRPDDRKEGQYHFVTKQQFEKKIKDKDILEYDIYSDNYYGLSKEEVNAHANSGEILLKDLTLKGVINCRNLLKDKVNVTSVFLTVKKSVLKQRLIARNTKNIKQRLKVYNLEQSKMDKYDYVIINNNLDSTIAKTMAIINHSTNKLPLFTLESKNKYLQKHIDKEVLNVVNNKKQKPIIVTNYNNEIYILKGTARYIANYYKNNQILKKFVDNDKPISISEADRLDWIKLITNYKP